MDNFTDNQLLVTLMRSIYLSLLSLQEALAQFLTTVFEDSASLESKNTQVRVDFHERGC